MKKLIALIMVLTLAAFAICGCTKKPASDPASPTATPASDAQNRGDSVTQAPSGTESGPFGTIAPANEYTAKNRSGILYWDSVRVGGGNNESASYEIFTDYDAFSAKFGGVVRGAGGRYTAKSFEESFVIAAYVTVPTGGYTVGLNRGIIENGTAELDISQEAPAAGTVVTQAFETHCVLVAVSSKVQSEDLAVKILVNGVEQTNVTVG